MRTHRIGPRPRAVAGEVMRRRRSVAVFVVLALTSTIIGPAGAATRKPDLVVVSVSNPPAAVAQGGSFAITEKVRNIGKRRATVSTTRYYLSLNGTNGLSDVRLFGSRNVKALSPGRGSSGSSSLQVPLATPPKSYFVLACADDFRKVREASEGNNCRSSKTKVRVTAYVVFGAGKPELEAFGDSVVIRDDEELIPALQNIEIFACRPSGSGSSTFAQALTTANSFLVGEVGQEAIDELLAMPEAQTPEDAEGLAAASAAAGAPAAALVVLIHAHSLEPSNPQHLINAAPFLTALGMPAEAIAFLNKAAGRADNETEAFGANEQAIALNNRGQALIALGSYGTAKNALRAARAIDENLSEASINLAVAELCSGSAPRAASVYRAGARRQDFQEVVKNDLDLPEEQAAAEELFDTSQGTDITLPAIRIPATPEDGAAMGASGGYYDALQQQFFDRMQVRQGRENALQQQAVDPSPASAKRIADISWSIANAHVQPELRDLYQASVDAFEEYSALSIGYWNDEVPTTINEMATTEEIRAWCIPRTRVMHDEFNTLMQHVEETGLDWIQAQYRYATGLVANIEDPVYHEIYSLIVEGDADAAYFADVWNLAKDWSGYEALYAGYCVEQPSAPPPVPEESDPDAPSSAACPPELAAASVKLAWSTTTVDMSLSVNCERAELETSSVGPIGAFMSVEHGFMTNQTTLFAGAKAGVMGAGTKSGLYVKFGANGDVEDVGFRTSADWNIGHGEVELKVWGDQMDISFAGTITELRNLL